MARLGDLPSLLGGGVPTGGSARTFPGVVGAQPEDDLATEHGCRHCKSPGNYIGRVMSSATSVSVSSSSSVVEQAGSAIRLIEPKFGTQAAAIAASASDQAGAADRVRRARDGDLFRVGKVIARRCGCARLAGNIP